jgi:hypothetical protein
MVRRLETPFFQELKAFKNLSGSGPGGYPHLVSSLLDKPFISSSESAGRTVVRVDGLGRSDGEEGISDVDLELACNSIMNRVTVPPVLQSIIIFLGFSYSSEDPTKN